MLLEQTYIKLYTFSQIYWTDSGRNSIEVAELDGRNQKVLIWSGLGMYFGYLSENNKFSLFFVILKF